MRSAAFAAAAILVLAACSSQDDNNENLASGDTRIVENEVIPPDENMTAAGPLVPEARGPAEADSGKDIPPMVRGRWGLVPADCTSTHGDAKGLLEVTPTALNFYESRGTLEKISEHEPSRIRARFSFTGEGMSWQRDMLLDVQDGGQTLIRTEFGDGAAPAPLRYSRCP
ncbi:MAG: hypothetical protein AB7U35_10880 [Sphingobium sp.]